MASSRPVRPSPNHQHSPRFSRHVCALLLLLIAIPLFAAGLPELPRRVAGYVARRLAPVTPAPARTAAMLAGGISLTTLGTAVTQNFDGLATSGTANTWTDDTTLTGWYSQFTATPANPATYRADAGGSNTGAIYSWGTGIASERAFGSVASSTPGDIYNAVKLTNNTGATITSLLISYSGEQWRAGGCTGMGCVPASQKLDFQYQIVNAGVMTDANTPATGWTDHDMLDFTSPVTGTATAAALDGNATANRAAVSATITVTVANGQEIWLRWKDINDANNDHGLGVDDFSLTPMGAAATTTLSVNDITMAEGDSGDTSFIFTVMLSAQAGTGGVTFDIATANNTALAPGDYTSNSLTGQTIPAGSSTYSFTVLVKGDTTVEPNESFFVRVTNIAGATAGDPEGLGTINNDDVTLTPIHDIQGSGASSPLAGASVTTRGIVTGVKSNGFFIQEPDATIDADPATSEGIFVFTGSPVPATAVVGNLVQVTGTVTEFIPSATPLAAPLTEISGSPTVSVLTTGNPLPTPVALSATFPDPAGVFDQLERVEGMRVSVASLTVVAPTEGFKTESAATSTSNGLFYGVVTGVARPFREPGIRQPDPAPAGTIPPIPRFDGNPELLGVDSDAIGGTALNVATGAVVTGLTGPLDYSNRTYTILPEPATPPAASGGKTTTAVSTAASDEFTIATFNLERFYDDINDPGGDTPLTPAAYQMRLAKASLAIRDHLKTPDIVGVVEMEKLSVLQALAAKISVDAIAAGQPDPLYMAFLEEGNDVGGIDVGFLIKTAPVAGATPRVSATAFQESKNTLFVNPDT
ncbi:MAG: hypothetical protein ACKV2V_00355, partial [Blastocatellia bacterium]